MKVLIFIALKIVEVLGFGFGPYWLGRWMQPLFCEWMPNANWNTCPYWICGFIIALAVGFTIWIITLNWIWATNIHKELRS